MQTSNSNMSGANNEICLYQNKMATSVAAITFQVKYQ